MALFSVQKVQVHMSGPGIIVQLFASDRQLFASCKQSSADSCPGTALGFLDGTGMAICNENKIQKTAYSYQLHSSRQQAATAMND